MSSQKKNKLLRLSQKRKFRYPQMLTMSLTKSLKAPMRHQKKKKRIKRIRKRSSKNNLYRVLQVLNQHLNQLFLSLNQLFLGLNQLLLKQLFRHHKFSQNNNLRTCLHKAILLLCSKRSWNNRPPMVRRLMSMI